MKQKKLNDILYVFDITPYVITEDTDAEVIKVQEECYAGYVELNPDLTDKIVKYNYHIACVNVPEWAPYVDGDQPEPQPDTYKLTLSGTILNFDCASIFINHEQVEKQEEYDLDEGKIVEIFPYNDSSYYTIEQGSDRLSWDDGVESGTDPHWWMQMPAEDVAIEIDYNPEPQTVTNLFCVNSIAGENPLGGDNIWDSTESEWAKNLDYYDVTSGDGYFEITLAVGHNYNIFNATIEYMGVDGSPYGEQVDDHYDFTMPDNYVDCAVAEPEPQGPKVTVVYNVQNTSEPLKIYDWPDSSFDSNVPDQMFVDGAIKAVSDTYQFDSTGDHDIQYIFNDGCFDIGLNEIDQSYNSIVVVSVEVNDAITSVVDYAWGIKANQLGASEADPLPLTYLPIVPPTINSTGASDVEAPGATVYVPADSVTDYQQASVWSDIAQLIQAIVPE